MSKPTVVSEAARTCASLLRGARATGWRQRGASFPEILLAVGLFSLLATFVVPPAMQWFQQTEVTRTMRADCQVVILDQMRTGSPSASPGNAKDCATAAPEPAASAASATSAAAR